MKHTLLFVALSVFCSFTILAQQYVGTPTPNVGTKAATTTNPRQNPLAKETPNSLLEETSVTNDTLATELAIRAQMAMSTPEYRVTPGDIYTMAFAAGNKEVVYKFAVDPSYKVRVANMGMIDTHGMRFMDLKKQVEAIVNRNYPLSGIQFALTTPATFAVTVKGEITKTKVERVWGLDRLSMVLKNLTDYASIRNITITSSSGAVTVYDYFKALRHGDLSQDPYLRPGDVISIPRVERSITITGEVNRPGIYQLLAGENLAELVSLYGDGLTPVADTSRIELVRFVESESISGDKLFYNEEAVEENVQLKNLDEVYISSRRDLIPVMYLEGAIRTPGLEDAQVSQRIEIRFNAGENYSSLVRNNRFEFTSISDTKNAYILRGDERIPINLNPILYDSNYRSDYTIENEDILIIPFRQFFVTVTGAVIQPGRYPYIPDRDWDYYIALAGGFDKERNSFGSVSITDIQGNKRSKKHPILPESIIDAKNSTFVYYFNKYAPVVVTTVGIFVSYFTIKDLINKN